MANRLGLYHVKTELENLSFKYRCPREYKHLELLQQEEEKAELAHINEFIAKIESLLRENGIYARTELRNRMPYSIWRKMQSKGCDFNHVDGKHYIRIIYDAPNLHEEKKESLHITPCLRIISRSVRAAYLIISTPPRKMVIRVSMSSC